MRNNTVNSNSTTNINDNKAEDNDAVSNIDSRFNQTLKTVQGMLKSSSFPGKALLSRLSESSDVPTIDGSPWEFVRSYSENDAGPSEQEDESVEGRVQTNDTKSNETGSKSKPGVSTRDTSKKSQEAVISARVTDSTRILKFNKTLSTQTVILEKLRELAWSGVPSYMRPNVWRLLLGYAPTNSDRRDGVLRRKRLEYLDCVAQYYDIPDTERSDDEINMLRQIAVDCPRTVPDVTFFQQPLVQKSLERILYTWAIRHPASGYVQGINDIVTPFLVVFLSEHLNGSIDNWSSSGLSKETIANVEADCYWCLSKMLDSMQDHYTFAQPGIQRLVFKLKELVQRIDEPVSRHMEEQGLEFLQFAFRWLDRKSVV